MINEVQAHAALFHLTGVGVVQTDMVTGHLVRANQAFCEMVGYSEAELRVMTNADLTHPDDWGRDAESFTALQQGEIQGGTSLTRCVRKDGTVVWLELHVTILRKGNEAVNIAVVNDVTERKRAEETLRASEVRQRFLLYLGDAIRPLTNPIEIQDAVSRLLGEHLEVDRAYYAEIDEAAENLVVHHDSRRADAPSVIGAYPIEHAPTLTAALRTGEPFVISDVAVTALIPPAECEVLESIDVRAAAAVPLVKHGRTVAALAVSQAMPRQWTPAEVAVIAEVAERTWDTVERARAEQALRESEARFRSVFSSNMVAMGVWTKTGDVIDANDQLLDLIGYTREELGAGSVSWVQLTPPEYHARDEQAVAEVMAYGACTPYEKEFIRKDRRRIPVMIGGGRSDEHTGAGIFFTVDLTDNKRAEFALRELNETLEQRVEERTEQLTRSEQRFSQAFHSNPISACMTTFGRETFVEVNDAFLTLTGYERDEVVGRSSRELSMWSSPEDHRKLSEAQHDERGFRNLELKLRTKEGGGKDILISAAVIRLDDDEGYLKMFYDNTERKRTEEQMSRAIQDVMTDTGWFSHKIMDRLANIRSGGTQKREIVDLSQRERQVLERMAGGMDNNAIAAELGIAVQTVRNYVSTVYDKLGVHSRGEAIIWARERGITGP